MKKLFLSLIIASASLSGLAQSTSGNAAGGNVLDLKHSITDPAIVYPESFEADTQKLLESWYIKNYTSLDSRYSTLSDPDVSDRVIIERLSALPTVIEMPFNQIVRNYIDRFTKQGRTQVAALLGLGLYYNPIFEQALEEQGLPLELEYLPMIESSLDPNAVSKHGAAGLWQFMLATAKGLGMEVNSLVDERRDPYLSSEMAASYLKGLYDTYGDWSLAIAAYNCGPGNINKAIRRAGGEAKDHDFWSIYPYLPEETRGYVPMFIAATYVMNYYPEHNISPVLATGPLVMDTIHVTERIHFEQISNVLDIPIEELRILNPQYRADIIPGTADTPRNLILPSQQIHAYLMSENEIRNYDADKYSPRSVVDPADVTADALATVEETEIWPEPVKQTKANPAGGATHTIVHKVKAGENLNTIAALYEVTPEQIKTTNNLRRSAVRVGQQLKITTDAPQAAMETAVEAVTKPTVSSTQKKTATTTPKKTTTNPTSHKVRSGESLSTISKKYGVSIAEIKKANGMTNDNLRAGQTIKIPPKKTGTTSSKKSTAKKKSTKKR